MASALQVILTEDSLTGKAGELIKVRPGFARNFLLRRGLAVVADKDSLRLYEEEKAEIERLAAEKREKAEKTKETIGEEAVVTITSSSGVSGKLFGSITKERIAEAINKELKVEVTKDNVRLKSAIKSIGEFPVDLDLGSNVKTAVTIKVVAEK